MSAGDGDGDGGLPPGRSTTSEYWRTTLNPDGLGVVGHEATQIHLVVEYRKNRQSYTVKSAWLDVAEAQRERAAMNATLVGQQVYGVVSREIRDWTLSRSLRARARDG